jgi:DNA-directed RNA polymerase specialized sigma24 family protein
MTRRKVARHVNHERRQKRGGGQVRGESVFVGAGAADSPGFGLEQIEGKDDAISFGVQLAEETEWLFEILGDEELCRVAELKLADCTNEEIAKTLGCHARTVKRRLQIIRSILSSAMSSGQ